MTATTLKPGTGKELKRLFALLAAAIGETLGSLVSRQISVRIDEPAIQDVDTFLAALPRPCAVARGALDKGFAGKSFLTMIEMADAIAMAGLLMMTPVDVVDQRRVNGTLEGEDAEAFGELGNVLYSGFGGVLREQVGNIDIRYQDHAVLKPGVDKSGVLGTGQLMVLGIRMKVGDFPETQGALAVDVATAEAWNKGPIELGGADAPPPPTTAGQPATAPTRIEDEGLDSIPAAPVRGTLAAFVQQADALRLLRRSCRRVGFDLRRHGRGEIPNPAAHRNEVVVLDVPPGEERRFDWCRRIKDMSATTKVVLLLHHPSRARVTQAFLSKADAIIGFPCDEMQLSQKLGTLLPAAPAPTQPPPDAPPPDAPA
jgi:hypothetical protein